MRKGARKERVRNDDDSLWSSMGKAPGEMKQRYANFVMAYPGLKFYERLGLTTASERVEGTNEKRINIKDTYEQIKTIRLIAGMLEKNNKEIADLAKSLPKPILYKMPYALMEISVKVKNWSTQEMFPKVKDAFWKVMEERAECTIWGGDRITEVEVIDFYFGGDFIDLVKKEVESMG